MDVSKTLMPALSPVALFVGPEASRALFAGSCDADEFTVWQAPSLPLRESIGYAVDLIVLIIDTKRKDCIDFLRSQLDEAGSARRVVIVLDSAYSDVSQVDVADLADALVGLSVIKAESTSTASREAAIDLVETRLRLTRSLYANPCVMDLLELTQVPDV